MWGPALWMYSPFNLRVVTWSLVLALQRVPLFYPLYPTNEGPIHRNPLKEVRARIKGP